MSKGDLSDRLRIAIGNKGKIPADLCRDLGIPKSALSQYLNGKSKNMSADRLQEMAIYLNVAEAWLMGFDVPMDRDAEPSEDHAPEERELLGYFRKLNDVGKQKALDELSMYTQIPALTQEGLSQQTDIA